MLHLLTEPGLRSEFVVGASARAINAAGANSASDPTPHGMAPLDPFWPSPIPRRWMPLRSIVLFRAAPRRHHRFNPSSLRLLL